MRLDIFFFGSLLSVGPVCLSQPQKTAQSFPVYLTKDFEYATFTRFEAQAPPKDHLVQSNGFLTLVEEQFGKQAVLILAPVDDAPGNTSDRLAVLEVDSPAFLDSSGRKFDFSESPARRFITYFADRTVYRAAFNGGPEVSFT